MPLRQTKVSNLRPLLMQIFSFLGALAPLLFVPLVLSAANQSLSGIGPDLRKALKLREQQKAFLVANREMVRVRIADEQKLVPLSARELEFAFKDQFQELRAPLSIGFSKNKWILKNKNRPLIFKNSDCADLKNPMLARQCHFSNSLVFSGRDFRIGGNLFSSARAVLLVPSFGQKKGLEEQADVDSFSVVLLIPLDDYLFGVLNGEMPLSWPDEALKAQIIAAHSYLRAKIESSKQINDWPKSIESSFFDVESSVKDQVFKDSLKLSSSLRKKFLLLIKGVRNELLRHPGGGVLLAHYHSDCGGKTLAADKIWPGAYSAGVAFDPVCETRAPTWMRRFSEGELRKSLVEQKPTLQALNGNGMKIDRFSDGSFPIILKPKAPDTKAEDLRPLGFWLIGPQGAKDLWLSANELRRVLGFSRLPGSLFLVDQSSPTETVFIGRGRGHGVGLCQYGARHWAEAGYDYKKILKHYYPKALLL